MFFSGRIYPSISKATHEVTPDQVPIDKNALLLHVADPHDARPFATAWVAKNPDGRWIFIAETPLDQSMPFWEMKRTVTLREECLEFQKVETWVLDLFLEHTGVKKVPHAIYRILDRHFGWQARGHKDGEVKTTMADLLVAVGAEIKMPLVFSQSYSSNDKAGEITVGHKMGNDALTQIGDYPGVVFYEGTTYHMMNSLTHYIKERVEGKLADKIASASGKIVEKFKDHADVYRMAIGTQIQAEIPEPEVAPIDQWAENIDGGLEAEEYADAFEIGI